MKPGAVITLHGSIDEGFVSAISDPTRRERNRETARRQAAFAERFDVPRGWLLYRTEADYAGRSMGAHLVGQPEPLGTRTDLHVLLVEEDFLRSCLTRVQVDPFEDTLVQRLATSERLRARMAALGAFTSRDLRCV